MSKQHSGVCDFCCEEHNYVRSTQWGIYCKACLKLISEEMLEGIEDIERWEEQTIKKYLEAR